MIRVTPKAGGLDRLRTMVRALPGLARRSAGAGLFEVADAAAAEIRQTLPGQSRPSGPGTPPADPAGHIVAAISVATDDTGSRITVDLPFAADLEYGTRRMAPRPFLRPAALRASQGAVGSLGRHLSGLIKQGRR